MPSNGISSHQSLDAPDPLPLGPRGFPSPIISTPATDAVAASASGPAAASGPGSPEVPVHASGVPFGA